MISKEREKERSKEREKERSKEREKERGKEGAFKEDGKGFRVWCGLCFVVFMR